MSVHHFATASGSYCEMNDSEHSSFEINNFPIDKDDSVYRSVTKRAQFVSNEGDVLSYLSKAISYPDSIDITGVLALSFIVEKDGRLSTIQVLKSLHPLLDTIVIDVMKQMPKWQPASWNENIVRSYNVQTVQFQMKEIPQEDIVGEDSIVMNPSERATYKGGNEGFLSLLREHLKKPNLDFEGEISVPVEFIIEKDGSISNLKVLRYAPDEFQEEALRVLKLSSGNWIPAKQDGKEVRSLGIQIISFILN